MYKIAVCDNQESCLDAVKNTVEQYCKKHQIDVDIRYFNDSDELMDLVEGKKLYDVYFLDVDMPCYSGMDLVKKIRELTSGVCHFRNYPNKIFSLFCKVFLAFFILL